MKKYLIEKVNVNDPVTGTTNGRNWTRWSCGVKIAGVWYNQSLFEEKIVNRLKEVEGQEIPLVLYDEEYQGKIYKKFKIPGKLDMLTSRVDELEEKMKELEAKVNTLQYEVTSLTMLPKEDKPIPAEPNPAVPDEKPQPDAPAPPEDEPPFTPSDDLPF